MPLISENYKETITQLRCLSDTSADLNVVKRAAIDTTLCHYGMGRLQTLCEARVVSWERKMAHITLEPLKLCSLPLTDTSFEKKFYKAHLAAAII